VVANPEVLRKEHSAERIQLFLFISDVSLLLEKSKKLSSATHHGFDVITELSMQGSGSCNMTPDFPVQFGCFGGIYRIFLQSGILNRKNIPEDGYNMCLRNVGWFPSVEACVGC
jgi:hypothetical protein